MHLNVDGAVILRVQVDPLVLGYPVVILALVGIQRHLGLRQLDGVNGLSRIGCGRVILGRLNSDVGTSGG